MLTTADCPCVITVFDYIVYILSAHAADIIITADCACVITVFDYVFIASIMSAHATDVACFTADCACVIAVFDCAVIFSAHAAYIGACSADCACVIAAFDCTVIIMSAHAACISCSADCACVIAACNRAVIISAHAADFFITVYIGIYNAYIRNTAGCANTSEQTDIACLWIIEIQSAYGITMSLKCAQIFAAVITDRRPFLPVLSFCALAACNITIIYGNILRKDRFYFIISAVYLLCKPIKLTCVADFVNAAVILCCSIIIAAYFAKTVFIAVHMGIFIKLTIGVDKCGGVIFCIAVVDLSSAENGVSLYFCAVVNILTPYICFLLSL